jgi:hypothetical protein
MSMPQLNRMEVFRQVRVVLVRHLIDIGRLSIQLSMSLLRLHGSLCRLPGVTTPLTADVVKSIFSELGRIQGLRRVDGEFDNWRQVDSLGTVWEPVAGKKTGTATLRTSTVSVLNIKDKDVDKSSPSQGL